jgi:hypothetical protein
LTAEIKSPYKVAMPKGERFDSGREACRYLLRNARTGDGHFLPLTSEEIVLKLQAAGFPISPRDAEALLHDLAADGEVTHVDSLAGYRWASAA